MQVPERLALIGGGILLSSTLIFTLKSQASSIIPKVGHSISNVYDHIGDTQQDSNFSNNYQQAQQNHWQTGMWGSSKYYIDDQNNLHVGSGKIQGKMMDIIGSSSLQELKSINLDGKIQAPQDSSFLFSGNDSDIGGVTFNLSTINGTENLDTSQVTNMQNMISNNKGIYDLDLSGWDVSHVTSMYNMFIDTSSLKSINTSGWDVSHVRNTVCMFANTRISPDFSHWQLNHADMSWMFATNYALNNINISGFNTTDSNESAWFSDSANINKITLGDRTPLNKQASFPTNAIWKNDSQTLTSDQLTDNTPHPGTWVRQ